jgi:hypothetical protein
MTAVVAAYLLKRQNVMDLLKQPKPTEMQIMRALVNSSDKKLNNSFLQSGGNLYKLVLHIVETVESDSLEAVLSSWGLKMEDAMDAAIKSRSLPVVEALMKKDIDPNASFADDDLTAIEYLISDPGKMEVESKRLVRFLLEKQVPYDSYEVERLAKKRKRDD